MSNSEKLEAAHELASKCSYAVWNILMEDPRFTVNEFGCGANDIADIVLNVVLDKLSSGINVQ